VFDDTLCWAVLFASLGAMDVEEEAKRVYLLVPHYNFTFVQFASTTIEEVPDISEELGVNASNVPRVRECTARRPTTPPARSHSFRLRSQSCHCVPRAVLFNREGRNATHIEVDCGEGCVWYEMEKHNEWPARGLATHRERTLEPLGHDGRGYPRPESDASDYRRIRERMLSKIRRGDALGSAVKAALEAAGNPHVLSSTRIPSTMVERDRIISPDQRFPIYSKLPASGASHDEL
tara:strand:+ start:260 stop:964 length:705 start_codon:yes stop_codon:yes gene_type:complete